MGSKEQVKVKDVNGLKNLTVGSVLVMGYYIHTSAKPDNSFMIFI